MNTNALNVFQASLMVSNTIPVAEDHQTENKKKVQKISQTVLRSPEKKEAFYQSLRENILVLTPEVQQQYRKELSNNLVDMAICQVHFAFENQCLQSKKNLTDKEYNYFINKKNEQFLECKTFFEDYSILSELNKKRAQAIDDAIGKLIFQNQFLLCAEIGNGKTYQTPSWLSLKYYWDSHNRDYNYGIDYRFTECQKALEQRHSKVKNITNFSTQTSNSIQQTQSEDQEKLSRVLKDVRKLHSEVVRLQEETQVYRHVLKRQETRQITNHRTYVIESYIIQKQKLDELKGRIDIQVELKDIHLQEIEKNNGSSLVQGLPVKVLANQVEKEEIKARWLSITTRIDQISKLMTSRITDFKLTDEELNRKTCEEYRGFSKTCQTAYELMLNFAEFKETLILSPAWDKNRTDPQKQLAYQADEKKLSELQTQKENLSQRICLEFKRLIATDETLTEYKETILQNLQAIDTQLISFATHVTQRATWDSTLETLPRRKLGNINENSKNLKTEETISNTNKNLDDSNSSTSESDESKKDEKPLEIIY